ncbi:hypothetical protein [Planktothrix mougeotii]|uniref:Transposase n=1 Tax=Planktothrix mougeotii LEGE 06226 TaxID=1828728 RepID=A0ABR9UCY3_9CYAN|nr:hypothetical protein [Planktothrix mougeotii]MBE9144282.1 hypothetical protein [Planktothrix mougeotii LEGE 06226]
MKKLRSRRLNKIKKALGGKAITVVVDETGDRKKGNKTQNMWYENFYSVYANSSFEKIMDLGQKGS